MAETPQPIDPKDAQPDPEPIAPSLNAPDPGIYHHEPDHTEEDHRA